MSNIRAFIVLFLTFAVASAASAGGSWDSSDKPTKLAGKNWQKMTSGKVLGLRGKAVNGRSMTHHYNRPMDIGGTLPLPAGPWVEVELILADGTTTQTVSLDGGLLRIGALVTGDAVAEDAVLDSGLIQFADALWPADGSAPSFSVDFRVE